MRLRRTREVSQLKYRVLGKTGELVSIMGFGASPLGNVFDVCDEVDAQRAVREAIDNGVTYFDVAPLYGETLAESRLGSALDGLRDRIFLATKCCRDGFSSVDYSAARVHASIDESLKRLRTDYVDLLQIHDVEFCSTRQLIEETLPAARAVQRSGKARFIGISGLPVRYLRKLAGLVELDTILCWGHYNLLEDELDDELTSFCVSRQIGLINASPFLQRLLTDEGAPAWHRSPPSVIARASGLVSLCRDYGVPLSDVALRFCIEHPYVATTVTGMNSVRQLRANLKALDLAIPNELLAAIESFVQPVKNMMWFEGRPENNVSPTKAGAWFPQEPPDSASQDGTRS
jgi:L-galactose dehydrogenase